MNSLPSLESTISPGCDTTSAAGPTIESRLRSLASGIREQEYQLHRTTQFMQQQVKHLRRVRLLRAYYALSAWLRSPAKHYQLYTLGVLVVGATFILCVSWSVVALAVSSTQGRILGTTLCFVAGYASLCALLFVPAASELTGRLVAATQAEPRLRRDISGRRRAISEMTTSLTRMQQNRDALLRSAAYQRELLLQQNWRAMRGLDWEAFLAEVCEGLGGKAELTKKTGDQGVDLIAQFGDRRVAVQAKGYHGTVGNDAVQQAVAGRAHYRCHGCAVITNSRFTPAAVELAASNACTLIGEDELPDFVKGNIAL